MGREEAIAKRMARNEILDEIATLKVKKRDLEGEIKNTLPEKNRGDVIKERLEELHKERVALHDELREGKDLESKRSVLERKHQEVEDRLRDLERELSTTLPVTEEKEMTPLPPKEPALAPDAAAAKKIDEEQRKINEAAKSKTAAKKKGTK